MTTESKSRSNESEKFESSEDNVEKRSIMPSTYADAADAAAAAAVDVDVGTYTQQQQGNEDVGAGADVDADADADADVDVDADVGDTIKEIVCVIPADVPDVPDIPVPVSVSISQSGTFTAAAIPEGTTTTTPLPSPSPSPSPPRSSQNQNQQLEEEEEEEELDVSGCFVVSDVPVKSVVFSPTTSKSFLPSLPPPPVETPVETENADTTAMIPTPPPSTLKSDASSSGTVSTLGGSSSVVAVKRSSFKKDNRKPKKDCNPFIPAAIDYADSLGAGGSAGGSVEGEHHIDGRIQLGICAMDKKARSKPMAEILSRLDETLFRVVFFGDDLILNHPIDDWPSNIDVLIAFYSKGYPLTKAKEYVKLRNVYLLNDLNMQSKLQDRRKVYDMLEASGIDVPRHVFLSLDNYKSTGSGDGNMCFNKKGKNCSNNSSSNSKSGGGGSGQDGGGSGGGDGNKKNKNKDGKDGCESSSSQSKSKQGNTSKGSLNSNSNSNHNNNTISNSAHVEEYDDHIEINGVSIHKPFVEKPIDADDHNIAIYYPTSAGGGCKKLFRKIGNRSSEFYPDISEIRRDGSYVYEEFVETQGTDVKMYTVGPDYGHAEARKSPTVDGKVQRNADGKELRFPVILTRSEKEIARRIVVQFKQFVCGFDLLRVQEGHSVVSYCCDVNGFSFVKNSRKYYDDCAQILTEHMLAVMKPGQLLGFSTLDPLLTEVDNVDLTEHSVSSMNPLHHVARMLRQGGGTSNHSNGNESDTGTVGDGADTRSLGQLSTGVLSQMDDPTLLEDGAVPVREIPRELISEPASLPVSRDTSESNLLSRNVRRSCGGPNKNNTPRASLNMHQEELRCVIAVVRHGDRTPKEKLKMNTKEPIILQYFIDNSVDKMENSTKDLKVKAKGPMVDFLAAVRKIIEKYEAKATFSSSSSKSESATSSSADGKDDDDTSENNKLLWKFKHMRDILERWKISGLTRKLQIKPRKFDTDPDTGEKLRCKEVQLILKWGGDLTKLGENQAIKLGKQFRQEIYPDAPGGGILRLHSTFRHDLKIKTSDEGRVMKTAAAFAKGLLELEGEIPPILVSLVHKEKGSMHMLDPSGDKDVKLELDECKEKLSKNLQQDIDWRAMTEEDRFRLVGPPQVTSLRDALAKIGNPRKTLQMIYETMGTLIEELEVMLMGCGSSDEKAAVEPGGIPKGDSEEDGGNDAALSGVKLYKGETLLELTERWRFIHKRLYDKETDTFDLTRIPDVLDNVRFDVLHNPHLGLTATLHKLYSNAKDMADTVVPQEYGTTIAQKRIVGIKVCSSLLDKIRYDLHIARTDNKTDMRYMINMDYSADLPINTMGRRIRTRLYFTSESHLHTLINVLRFAAEGDSCKYGDSFTSPVLSPSGMELLNESKEVCYLTHFVIRLFEDTGRKISDTRRFRVEILFSAGATGTPIHQAQSTKGADLTRLDTEPLVSVGRDGLTCADVEDFFSTVINEGGEGDDRYDVASTSTAAEMMTAMKSKNKTPAPNSDECKASTTIVDNTTSTTSTDTKTDDTKVGSRTNNAPSAEQKQTTVNKRELDSRFSIESAATMRSANKSTSKQIKNEDDKKSLTDLFTVDNTHNTVSENKEEEKDHDVDNGDGDNDDDESNDKAVRDISHKYFYLTIATGTLLLGAGCLVMAMGLTKGTYSRRHYSRR